MGYKGIAFPFAFSASGGVKLSSTDYYNLDHLIEGLMQRLATDVGERPMELTVGSSVSKVLFSDKTETDIQEAKLLITQCIEEQEPRLKVVSVEVLNADDGGLEFDITVSSTETGTLQPISFALDVNGGIKV